MKAKKTYILPDTCHVVLSTRDKVLQDTLQDTFSGGDSLEPMTVKMTIVPTCGPTIFGTISRLAEQPLSLIISEQLLRP